LFNYSPYNIFEWLHATINIDKYFVEKHLMAFCLKSPSANHLLTRLQAHLASCQSGNQLIYELNEGEDSIIAKIDSLMHIDSKKITAINLIEGLMEGDYALERSSFDIAKVLDESVEKKYDNLMGDFQIVYVNILKSKDIGKTKVWVDPNHQLIDANKKIPCKRINGFYVHGEVFIPRGFFNHPNLIDEKKTIIYEKLLEKNLRRLETGDIFSNIEGAATFYKELFLG